MKGLDVSLSVVLALVIGLIVITILATIVSGNLGNLENFALDSIDFINLGGPE